MSASASVKPALDELRRRARDLTAAIDRIDLDAVPARAAVGFHLALHKALDTVGSAIRELSQAQATVRVERAADRLSAAP